jgi:hypothetical protein
MNGAIPSPSNEDEAQIIVRRQSPTLPVPVSPANMYSPAIRSLFSAANLYHIPDSEWYLDDEYDHISSLDTAGKELFRLK